MTAGRRRHAFAHPAIQVGEQGRLKPPIVVRIGLQLPTVIARRPSTWTMLRSREQENSHVGRVAQIFGPVQGEVPQGRDTPAIPIFGAGVDQENLWLLSSGYARPQSVTLPGCRVGSDLIAERTFGVRQSSPIILLCEALIETAQTGPAGLDEQRVDRLPPLLVGSEALVD